jgi:nitroreductase/NAD-dependent dihydropyrimidine dehydrogenase PreA subunit
MPVIHSLYRETGQVSLVRERCDQCLACARVCPTGVLAARDKSVRINPESTFGCIACGHCMMVCPTGAVRVSGRGLQPEDLRPLPDPGKKAGVEELSALMVSRRSVRRFTEREVEDAVLERIVALAATAPMGIPPWDVGCVTVRGRAEVQRLAREVVQGYAGFLKIFQPWLLALMRPLVPRAKYEKYANFVRPLAQEYVQGRREHRDLLFHDAPALLLFHNSPYAEPADAFIACTYAMLAAEALGLGSTMIGAAAPIIQRNPALCRRLGLPPGHQPAIALILGYPATHFQRSIRRNFVSVFTHRDGEAAWPKNQLEK